MNIVILPGLDGTGAFTLALKKYLAPLHDVPTMTYPMDLCRYGDLQNWVTGRLPKGDFVIVAESFSGPLAISIALTKPKALKGVVFAASFAKSPRNAPHFLTYLLEIAPIKSRPLIWLAQPFVMGRWRNQAFTTQFRSAIQPIPNATFARRLRAVLAVDFSDKIRFLDIPIMYLRAKNDWLVPRRMARDFELPDSAIIEVDGPHFLLQANPQAASKHILDFTDRVG